MFGKSLDVQNQVQFWEKDQEWNIISSQLHLSNRSYWDDTVRRKTKSISINKRNIWNPPLLGWIKLNFDAAYINREGTVVVIRRNHEGCILIVWVDKDNVISAFATEECN